MVLENSYHPNEMRKINKPTTAPLFALLLVSPCRLAGIIQNDAINCEREELVQL